MEESIKNQCDYSASMNSSVRLEDSTAKSREKERSRDRISKPSFIIKTKLNTEDASLMVSTRILSGASFQSFSN